MASGHCREERELREGDLNNEELENEKFIREMNEKELQMFREYQQGTEDLIPYSKEYNIESLQSFGHLLS